MEAPQCHYLHKKVIKRGPVYFKAKSRNVNFVLKVVSFDVVGTLVDFNYENYVWKEAIPQLYARKTGVSFERAKDYVLREYDRLGNKDIKWYLPDYWFRHLNLDENPIEVFKAHAEKVKFYSEVPSVLQRLSRKFDLIIASGATTSVIRVMIEKFRHCFKHIYSPISDCQEIKKEPQFYSMICKILEIKPRAIVHVGDDWYSDFISPRKINVKSFFLDRTGEKSGEYVVKDLRELEERLTGL